MVWREDSQWQRGIRSHQYSTGRHSPRKIYDEAYVALRAHTCLGATHTHTWRRENSQSTFIVSHSAPFRSSTVYQSSLHSSPFVLITQWFPGWGPLVWCKGTTDGPQKQQKVSLKFLRCIYFYKYIYLYKKWLKTGEKWLKTGDKSLWVWDITHYFSLKLQVGHTLAFKTLHMTG